MAWIFNGIENESDCVSAAGTLRNGKSDLASRRETMISTAMVFVMVFLAAVFFFAADQLLAWLIALVLNAGV